MELRPGPTAILLCPKHPRLSSHLGHWGGKRAGHSPSGPTLMITPNPSFSQQLPRKGIQAQKPHSRLQQPPFHALLLRKTSLSASSQLWALILAAGAVLKWSGRPLKSWLCGTCGSCPVLLGARSELTTAHSRNRVRVQGGAALPGWPQSHARSLRHHQVFL